MRQATRTPLLVLLLSLLSALAIYLVLKTRDGDRAEHPTPPRQQSTPLPSTSSDPPSASQLPTASENVPPDPMNAAMATEISNLLTNPGFEEGQQGWHWLQWSRGWAPFVISDQLAYEGQHSGLLPMRSEGDTRPTIVWGLVQELVLPVDMPDCIEGYYYIDGWSRGSAKQYLQLVIIDWSREAEFSNTQIRYIITGLESEPYEIGNAHYVFLETPPGLEPQRGSWVHFFTDPARDFRDLWGYTPAAGHRLRILFEARFDRREADSPPVVADVYYDNLYFGPAAGTHCAPATRGEPDLERERP